ncbi:hypothetical protein O3G_MSEX006926 [Manduca sexta]|nr:hypothetical protein O3G_MSEX006926 [Manduca sexta]
MASHIYLYLTMMLCGMCVMCASENDSQAVEDFNSDVNTTTRVLSRRKRYLVFPDGSSFQLVFCTQTHGYLQVGDIIWFGSTAALAWELPSDPNLFSFFKETKDYKGLRRSDASKHIYYLDENGKVISKVPYHRRPIVNPAFAKRSVDSIMENKTINLSIKDMHDRSKKMNYLDNLHESSIDFHREGRKSLYGKLEKFFQG